MIAEKGFRNSARGEALLTNALRTFEELPPAAKFLILLILKSTAASFVLGLFAPVATAVYAMRYGFRVPVEGVPFLTITISTWSFIGFALTLSILSGTYYIIVQLDVLDKLFAIYNDAIDTFSLKRRTISIGTRNRLLIIPSLILITTLFIFPLVFIIVLIKASAPTFLAIFISVIVTMYFILFMISTMASATGRIDVNIQLILAPIVILFMVVSLFVPDTYGSFLRVIRYGGGIEINIDIGNGPDTNRTDGYLLIQNNEVVILLLKDRKTVVEVPVRHIEKKSFSISPNWIMPSHGLGEQWRYINIEL